MSYSCTARGSCAVATMYYAGRGGCPRLSKQLRGLACASARSAVGSAPCCLSSSSRSRRHGISCPRRRLRANSSSGKGSDPEPSSDPTSDKLLAAVLAAGINGTLAVAGAALTRGDLYGSFRPLEQHDIVMTLQCTAVALLLEAFLFAPRWPAVLGAPSAAAAGGQGSVSTSSGSTSSSSSSKDKARGPGLVAIALPPLEMDELSSWTSRSSLSAVLVLCQSVYLNSQAARIVLPYGQEAALLVATQFSKEMLQRAFALTFLAGWLADRAFEAGFDDTFAVQLAALGGAPLELYLPDVMRWASAALVTASVMPAVVNEAEAIRLGVASNLAVALVDQQQQQQQQQRSKGESSESSADEDLDDPLIREYRLVDALTKSINTAPPDMSYWLALLRGLVRFGGINAAFALTGNATATFAYSAASSILQLLYVSMAPKLQRAPAAKVPAGKR